jgi:hypothetical protein
VQEVMLSTLMCTANKSSSPAKSTSKSPTLSRANPACKHTLFLNSTGYVDLQIDGVKRLHHGSCHRAAKPKDELKAIMGELNIPIDTPAVSMTQDDMKTKLASSNPAKLYQMFLEVSGLLKSWDNIVSTLREMKSTKAAFEACQSELGKREKAMMETKQLCEGIEQVSTHIT